jgi:SAM-dependent methyltransferase
VRQPDFQKILRCAMTGHSPGATPQPESSTELAELFTLEQRLVESYAKVAEQYRRDDELEVQSENHRRLGGNLMRLSASLGRGVRALDVGCGTGRFFHCLRNVRLLVGIDISAVMLEAAANPVLKHEVSVETIRLMQGNIYTENFPNDSFDLVYSLGVFGHGAPLTVEICRKFRDWLRVGGRLYFNVIETPALGPLHQAKKWLKQTTYPLLPQGMLQKVKVREKFLPCFTMTLPELEQLMNASGFSDFIISANVCRSPLWEGVHLECVATKTGSPC